MTMKKIILIDDDINKVEETFGNIYKILWKGKNEDGIASKVIFFGDQFKKEREHSELSCQDINLFDKTMKNMLRSHCRNEEQWNYNGELYKKKKDLITKASRISINQSNEIKNLVEKWRGNTEAEPKEDLRDINLQPLIHLILKEAASTNNPEIQKYFLLDVILLFDDIEKVEEGMPIISMGLYHALMELAHKCFLYSSYAYDYPLMDKYKDIYKEQYGEAIEVYSSKVFFSKKFDSEKCLFYHLNKQGEKNEQYI